MKKGFSLIELLISLIVISLIISAFMPILSNRLKHREVALGGSKIETKCSEKFNEKCMMCNDTSCILCTNSFSCPFGQYCDAEDDCKCKSCSAIYPNCTKCNKNYCESCIEGYKVKNGKCEKVICSSGYYLSGSECLPCVSPCATCDNATKCNSCIAGHQLAGSTCAKGCIGVVITLSGQKYCFTKKNLGDDTTSIVSDAFESAKVTATVNDSNGTISGKVTVVTNSSTKCSPAKDSWCCWKHASTAGGKATLSDSDNSGFDYSGQGRTACDWRAAYALCNKLKEKTGDDWQLPTSDVINALKVISNETKEAKSTNIQKWAGTSGLQLCDYYDNTHGSPMCPTSSNCKGAKDSDCTLHDHWGNEKSASNGNFFCLRGGKHNNLSNYAKSAAFSVRCMYKM